MILRTVTILAVAALVLLGGWSYGLNQEVMQLRAALAAQQQHDPAEEAAEQAVHDLIAVQALNTRYAHAFDFGERGGEAWAETFTADGVFVSRGNEVKGHEALAAFQQNVEKSGRRTRHVVSNIEVTRTGPDTATSSAYLSLYTPADEAGPASVSTSRYADQLVLTDAGWKIARREVVPDTLPPSE
jgi:uncharacterized protein (TIGR02246 family)